MKKKKKMGKRKTNSNRIPGIPLTLHGGRPSSRSSQRSGSGLASAFSRRPSSGGSRGPLVPASRAGAARAAAILLISCHLQATTKNGGNGGNRHRRTLSDVAEGSSDGLGRTSPFEMSKPLPHVNSLFTFLFMPIPLTVVVLSISCLCGIRPMPAKFEISLSLPRSSSLIRELYL